MIKNGEIRQILKSSMGLDRESLNESLVAQTKNYQKSEQSYYQLSAIECLVGGITY